MRSAQLVILLSGVGLWCGAGCGRPKAATLAPTQDELPRFEQIESVLPVAVGVEGRGEEPRVLLVPPFEEPELTPEERSALGEEKELDWLEFYQPLREGFVWSESGGAATARHGSGGAAVASCAYGPKSAVGGGLGGAATGALSDRVTRYRNSGRTRQVVGRGTSSGVRVGVNPPSRVSAHQRRRAP